MLFLYIIINSSLKNTNLILVWYINLSNYSSDYVDDVPDDVADKYLVKWN